MNPSAPSPAALRLQRLAGYLAQDPDNAALLADACEAAIACGAHDQAQGHIASARRLALDRAEWDFRAARLCLARGELPEAAGLLEELRESLGAHPVLAHDLAYVRLLQGDAGSAQELLQPWLDAAMPAGAEPARAALQALWLRACHGGDRLQQAWAWVQGRDANGGLSPAVRGVASLVAFDLGEPEAARALAEAALAADADQREALVARGSLALAEGDTARAAQAFRRALELHPGDGRSWSALGFASLLERDFASARSHLERAVECLPDDVETWQALGWARLLQGGREAALAALRAALALDPAAADSHAALALVHALLGEASQARAGLEAAQRLGADGVALGYARALLAGAATEPAVLDALARAALSQWRPRP